VSLGDPIYFWESVGNALREIALVLRRGGRLAVAHWTDPEAARDFPASVYRFPTADEINESLAAAGFVGCRAVTLAFREMSVSFHVAGR
jgi:SAM-dependent methyltransferase